MNSGIYKIENSKNGKVYIGQTKDFKMRWQHHKSDLRHGRHHNRHLQFAWNYYGEENFIFSIIEYCEESQLDDREKYWIDKYKSHITDNGYNSDLGGQGIDGYKHTEEEINKMRRIQSPHIVLQFDLDFSFVKEWIGGVSHINKELKYTTECLLLRCQHRILKMSAYKGFYWVFKEEYEDCDFTWEKYLNNEKIVDIKLKKIEFPC